MSQKISLQALNRVLSSLDAARNGPALYALLSTFCVAGLLLAMAESALARSETPWGVVWAGLALTVAFYGVNTTGLLLMDQALGRPVRDVQDALRDALLVAHRVLLSLAVVLGLLGLVLAALLALLWAARLPWLGAPLFALTVPLGVLLLGLSSFAVLVLVGPLTGPSVWAGQTVRPTLRLLARQLRGGLLDAAVLMAGVLLLTAVVSAAVSFVVVSGARAMSLLAIWGADISLPPQQLMAGLFGYGLRSLGAAGAPVAGSPQGMAALVGGGVVFALALVLPALIYLRGCCAVYLALREVPDEGL
ncbi:hypothetical protein OOZ63_10260 [Paucibacter sp. PLA-PC-4]|uniref:hypothetical protein n=1 Tax=Paucibacter sp. PLA-PC-4 TaxID=2993655 RepID=UPI002248A3BA|nr:hypothetical protein [Paucibacter sp. PLA-PC-4]MCX2862225.1 hypothetical protein [Paucibacter sp. PLA-PC-4]